MTNGGKDSGAINQNLRLYEKDLTLKLALALEKVLKEQGIDTVMTRRTDVTMNYVPRYQLENKNKCDLGVSIHLNSSGVPNTARGCEIWVHSRAVESVMNWANSMLTEILKVNGTANRGVKKGFPSKPNLDFWCNRLTKAPTMLIELGFINSDFDAKLVQNNIDNYAIAMAKGICKELGVEYKDVANETYEFKIKNLNNKNLPFLLDTKMATGERFEDWLKRQGYRYEVIVNK